jgi:hypothetical protein
VATTVFCCGAECGIVVAGQTGGGTLHWNTALNSPAVTTSTVRSGDRAYLFSANNLPCRLEHAVTGSPTVGVMRVYIRFPAGQLPDANCTVCGFVDAGNQPIGVQYNTATQTLSGIALATLGGSFPVVEDTWYRIDLRATVSATRQVEWQVDGVAQTGASQGAASTLATARIGVQLINNTLDVAGQMLADDILLSVTSGDYPLGASSVVRVALDSDGTHSFSANTDFEYNDTTGIATNATNTYTYIDELPTGVTDFLACTGAAAGEYLEWNVGTMPETPDSINGVEVVSAHHSQGTAANKQSLRMIDGVTTANVLTDADFSHTQIGYNSTHYTLAPSAVPWTQALVEALKFRWAGSFTAVDISPVPYIDGLMLEVDYVPNTTPIVTLELNQALACFTIDNLVQFSVGSPPQPPVVGAPGNAFVRRFGVGSRLNHVHRFLLDETEDR